MEERFPDSPAHVATAETSTLPADPAGAAEHILSTPFESVNSLPLEEIALAQTYLVAEAKGKPTTTRDKRLAGRIELANQTQPERERLWAREAAASQGRRRQHTLRGAIDKIQSSDVDSMMIGEIDLAMNCFTLLSQRISTDASDERLERILGAAMAEIDQRCARFRLQYADRLPKHARTKNR